MSNFRNIDLQNNVRENRKAIHNGRSIETGNIGYTRHKTKTYKKAQKTRKDKEHGSHSYHSDVIAVEFIYTSYFNFVHEKTSLFFFVLNNIKVL